MANSTVVKPWGLGHDNAILKDLTRSGGKAGRPYIMPRLYNQIVTYADYSDSDTSEALDLNATFTSNAFPANVMMIGGWLQLYQTFGGGTVSAATLILGDAGDDNELVASKNVFTGQALGLKLGINTNVYPQEAAYVPLLQLDTTDGNIDTLSSGVVGVFIQWIEIPSIPQANVRD
jgi:hypothetical protein